MHNSTEFLYGWKMLASCTTQHKYEQYLQSPPLRKKKWASLSLFYGSPLSAHLIFYMVKFWGWNNLYMCKVLK